jgi:hypothetical protein
LFGGVFKKLKMFANHMLLDFVHWFVAGQIAMGLGQTTPDNPGH